MTLYINNKSYHINIDGQVYKVMDPIGDYAKLVTENKKKLEDVPESLRTQVELRIHKII